MADKFKSVNFLPEVFQTPTNKKFLETTFDQLIQEPKLKQTQGYIGKTTVPGVTDNDTYIIEQNETRANYQLEPGIVFKENSKPSDALTYPGLLDGLGVKGSKTNNHDRLFSSETYSWSPFIDFDKFVNYSQYYWLPEGPDSVDVSATDIFLTNDFEIARNSINSTYTIDDFVGVNPVITVVRGGSYKFNVNQTGSSFYIQSEPGTSGTLPWADNLSSREVLGVVNNGEDNGTIEFNVPDSDAQNFYYNMTNLGKVDLATDLRFNQINHRFLHDISSINNIQDLQGKTIVFLNTDEGDSEDLGWVNESPYDAVGYDNITYAETTYLDTLDERYSIFQIDLVYDTNGENPYIRLFPVTTVNQNEKFTIQYGETYSNVTFYKNAEGFFEQVPLTTASLDRLYYQDANNPDMFGVINVINQEDSATLVIEDIIGQTNYTSPNGIVFTNGLKVKFRGTVEPAEYQNNEYYVEGVGESIQLLPVDEFITPEQFTKTLSESFDTRGYDTVGYNGSNNAPLELDYITINRASQDLNGWTRSNRWFHSDVIQATAEYNNSIAVYDNEYRASRPIIEFEPNLRLFNYGTINRPSVNIIDFQTTDALSDINGSYGYSIDGYTLVNGSRIIFAADTDPNVRNKIYTVEFADMNSDGVEVINLSLAEDSVTYNDEVLLISHGLTSAGKVYSYLNGEWIESQPKTSVNQAPLFDVYDNDGNSLSNNDIYSSTTFNGTKLFSYKEGSGLKDTVLGFPLTYLNINNLGDIVFENNLYSDTFIYVDNLTSVDSLIQDGFIRKYSSREEYTNEIGWVNSAEVSHVPQVFNFSYNGVSLIMDVFPKSNLEIPAVRVLVDNTFITPDQYNVSLTDTGTVITFNNVYAVDTKIEVTIISDQQSAVAYYKVPVNLSSNVFNENTQQLTLGIIRNHYNNLAQNIPDIQGNINGANNIRDLGNVSKYGDIIIQNSSPMSFVSQFIRKNEYNFFDALQFNSQYYEKFKYQLLDWIGKNDVYGMSSNEILEKALVEINSGKNIGSSFYYTDMMPNGTDYETVIHTVTAISTDTFSTLRVYDFTKASTVGILVYLNDNLLIKDTDYTVATDGPRITMLVPLEIDDVITFREYNSTIASNIPNTPTKLGLYKKYLPQKFLDNTYVKPVNVIRGHDGSITPAFDDVRDDVLLEFEKRIYNNIKVNVNIPVDANDIIPGQFRNTDYTDADVTEIMSPSLLSWLGWNKIDYKNQDYRADDERTWNYSKSGSKLDSRLLKGNWRGIFNFYYDTDAPHERPWEMLGLSEKPQWWELRYGPAPYTSGNKVLWDDLEAGLIKDPDNERTVERFKRPGLSEVIPVSSEGVLLSPLQVMVANYTAYDFKSSWKIGDQGPAETAFNKSSSYPFAIQRLLAVAKPAQYFALMVDRDRYTYNEDLEQYLYDGRHRIDSRNIEIVSADTPKHSYINWIADYNTHYGYNSIDDLRDEMANTDVNLCYRMASFTDKNNLKIFTDKSSPDSTNNSLLLPDESFNLLVYKNQPFNEVNYSAITVQKTDDGYAVSGNSTTEPYFKINPSLSSGNYRKMIVGRTAQDATTVRIPKDFSNDVVYVPYGFVFDNYHLVVDFIASYGQYLTNQGLQFNNTENGIDINWDAMIKEFVYWHDQGWEVSSVINLNPNADAIEFEEEYAVVDSLLDLAVNDQPQDQNRIQLQYKDYAVDRLGNNFKLKALNGKALGYLNFNVTSYEHLLILDNESIFNDLIYNPVTGVRQERVKLYGFTTYDWTGRLDPNGFMLNDDNIKEWNFANSYNKGNIVKFKNQYWSATSQVPASQEFNFSKWVKIDYNQITKGLISNAATKSDAMLRYYDNHNVNLEQDADLLSLGLTGFRPRDYLSSLDLDDISQVNIYQDMIQHKGTSPSLSLFKYANLNNEITNYEIFENWAIRRAVYGATSSRAYVEFKLNEIKHTSNPTTLQVVNDSASGTDAAQTVALNQIYKQSVKHNDVNILSVINDDVTDIGLPYAGFVNRDEVDIATFSLENYNDINYSLDKVIDGTLIWVAKDTEYDWNVYRATAIIPELVFVLDNLDGTLTLEFNGSHELAKNDIIIVKYFDEQLNGTHKVSDITSNVKIVVTGALTDKQTQIEDNGVAFVLKTAKIQVPSDIVDTQYNEELFLEDKVWVNNDNGKMSVYEKKIPFESVGQIQTIDVAANAEFGSGIAQGYDNYGAIITDPSFNNDAGTIYTYNKLSSTEYVLNRQIRADQNNLGRFGNSVSMSREWAIVGADATSSSKPGTGAAMIIKRDKAKGVFLEWQTLGLPGLLNSASGTNRFADNVIISNDENWALVSESINNKVHVYQKIEEERQIKTFYGDNVTQAFYISDSIKVDTADQLVVTVNESQLTPNTQYILDGDNVIIFTVPKPGEQINILRKTIESQEGNGGTTQFTIETLYTANGDNVTVFIDSVIQREYYDYTVSGNVVTLVDPPAAGAIVVFKTETYFKYITTIDGYDYGVGPNDRFGASTDIATDGSQIIITAPDSTVDGVEKAGRVYIFNRIIERFVVSDKEQTVYQTLRTSVDPHTGTDLFDFQAVRVNGNKLVSNLNTAASEYSINGVFVTLNYPEIKIGDFIDVDMNLFELVQTETAESKTKNANFGSSVSMCKTTCSVYVGAEYDSQFGLETGSVTRLANLARMNGIAIGTNANPVLNTGDTIRINKIDVTITNASIDQLAETINQMIIPNVVASVKDGKIVIELINKNLSSLASMLDVQPGVGQAFDKLGLTPYQRVQTFTSPDSTNYARFGNTIQISENYNQLIVGAVNGTAHKLVSYDDSNTTFDGKTMRTIDKFHQSGIVYTYDLLPDESVYSVGQMVFGHQIYDSAITTQTLSPVIYTADTTVITADSTRQPINPLIEENQVEAGVAQLSKFGHAVNIVDGLLMVASPGYDLPRNDSGRVVLFNNPTQSLSWNPIRVEQDEVDTSLINSIMIYDSETQNVKQYLDYIDPLNGKVLGLAQENLDYITVTDPATYESTPQGVLWGDSQLGKLWWDVQNARFIDYHQNDINYANKLWGKLFPGSEIEVYQWIESTQPPAYYDGEGAVKNVDDYVTLSQIGPNNTIENIYYYWVKGISSISTNSSKTLSAEAVASYIAAPSSAGVPYANLIKPNVYGLVNSNSLMDENKSVLHIEYDVIKNDDNIFLEYDLIKENHRTDFLTASLYKKLQDSFCGVDSLGNLVPDINLSTSEQQGVNFRPRQSMFKDKFAALSSYIIKVNDTIKAYPVAESKVYPLLNSEERYPAQNTGQWDTLVQNNEELSFQDLSLVDAGYRYLVLTDYTNNGFWTIQEVTENKTLKLVRVQSYDTTRYWTYEDWYDTDYDSSTKNDIVVNDTSNLYAINNPADGLVVKVLQNSENKWEIYRYDNMWNRVGLQDGTIQFSETLYDYSVGRFGFDVEVFDTQYFDQEPVIELRQIIKSINEEILTGDLELERNKMLMSVFDYIVAEQHNVDWLYKTSLIDVNHKVRSLLPYAVYQKDNQDYVIDYINETKPYHCKIKEFLLSYDGFDTMAGQVTDFDCPSYWNEEYSQFVSPVLDDGAILVTDPSNTPASDAIWTTSPWSEWYNNRALSFSGVTITNPGAGYTIAPQVIVIGESTVEAELEARINGAGQVTEVIVINPGSGYLVNPEIVFEGGNGSGAVALSVTKNSLVRSMTTTIKYDRYEYNTGNISVTADLTTITADGDSSFGPGVTADLSYYPNGIKFWVAGMNVNVGDKVRYENKAYEVLEANADETFIANKYKLINIETLSGVDRTTGFYVADVNNPGLDVALLINGIAYPGVEVDGVSFSANTGYDSALGFDTEPFDNVEIGPNGYETYSETILDARYESDYLDTYLGTRPNDINVDGGLYIDTYHSHAPEELVPGSIFDTLDLTVTTRPGSDYLNNGHGFTINSKIYQYFSAHPVIDIDDISDYPVTLQIINSTTGRSLYENEQYTVDWNARTVTIIDEVADAEYIKVFVSGIGGGDQLFRKRIAGSDVENDEYIIPVNADEILDTIIFINGIRSQNSTVEPIDNYTSKIIFSDSFVNEAIITITVLGINSESVENYYQTKLFVAGGADDARFNQAFFNVDVFSGNTQSEDTFIMPDGVMDDITTRMNAVVELNGFRLRSPEGKRYIGDGSLDRFDLPVTGDAGNDGSTSVQVNVADNEVIVIVDGNQLTLGVDYTVSDPVDFALFNSATFNNTYFYDPIQAVSRYVTLTNAPAEDSVVEVYITTEAGYDFHGDEIVFKNGITIAPLDEIAITTYGDTRELEILTEVFRGPTATSEADTDTYDQAGFDVKAFDLQEGVDVFVNIFTLTQNAVKDNESAFDLTNIGFDTKHWDAEKALVDEVNIDASRLWVTLNGERLNSGDEYVIVDNNKIQILGPVLADDDVLVVTSMSDSVVTDGVDFRLFKDMRGTTAMYSIGDDHETYLVQPLAKDDDIIYVHDASVLSQPQLHKNKFGIVIINGERITYRERDLNNNTISGLRRGTAGTGANDHAIKDWIYDASHEALVPWDYDQIWYEGNGISASNGIPLQEQTTIPALFIKN